MIISSYRVALYFAFPVVSLIGIFRLFLKKENFISLKQKLFAVYNYKKFQNIDTVIHFASIGELNSIKFLLDNLNNKKILLSCTTLSSYKLSQKKYPNINVIFLPLDFHWNVKKFILNLNVRKILWIDSEIWPNWLYHSKKINIKNILVNGRLSKKSYYNWKRLQSFSKHLGEKYELIFAKSLSDKEKFSDIFQKKIYYHGNLKFYLNVNSSEIKKNHLCFASIHKSEFNLIISIINDLDLDLFDTITIIPRHIQFSNILKSMLKDKWKNKIIIHDKFGESLNVFNKSKIVFMGGSLVNHGGQNPLEALSKGCFIISGPYNDNFNEQYLDLEKLDLAKILKKKPKEISENINKLIKLNFDNTDLIKSYFKDNTKDFNKIIEMIGKC